MESKEDGDGSKILVELVSEETILQVARLLEYPQNNMRKVTVSPTWMVSKRITPASSVRYLFRVSDLLTKGLVTNNISGVLFEDPLISQDENAMAIKPRSINNRVFIIVINLLQNYKNNTKTPLQTLTYYNNNSKKLKLALYLYFI